MEEVIDGILDELQMSTDTAAFTQALQLLHRIVGNVVQHPTDPKYRTLKLSNAKFVSQVWSHTAAQQFMLMTGWEEAGDSITLPMGMELSHVLKVLDTRVKTVLGDAAVAASAAAAAAVAAPAAAPAAKAAAAPAPAASATCAAPAAKASAGGCCGGGSGGSGGSGSGSGEAGQKRSGQDEALEKMRQDKLARERIKQQIAADRQNTAAREERASVARQLQPGSRITRFSDVGVDLNKKSG